MTKIQKLFAQRLMNHRLRLYMDRNEFAKMVGMTYSEIWRYETAQHAPSVERLFKIANKLGITVDDLYIPTPTTEGMLIYEMSPDKELIQALDYYAWATPNSNSEFKDYLININYCMKLIPDKKTPGERKLRTAMDYFNDNFHVRYVLIQMLPKAERTDDD